ncbi:MAG: hypothetical protein V1800_15890 [Candidatus Latescibacterota bacterium]
MDILNDIWNWKIQILPILLSILLFEAPAIIRRWKKLFYVPIYFSVFPLRELNQDLSTYLVEDDYGGLGERLTTEQAESLRKKIILISIVSMAIGALLTPLIVGFSSAYFMSRDVFIQFIIILLMYRVFLLSKSIYHFHLHAVGSTRNRILLGFVYLCYLGVVFEVLRTSYNWTFSYVQAGKWSDLFSDLSALVFGKALIGVLVLSLLTAVFVSLITDREIRAHAISRDEEALE